MLGFGCLYAAKQISIKSAYTARTLSVRSPLQNMAEEDLAHRVAGNDSGMYRAGFAGDDAHHTVLFGHDSGMYKAGFAGDDAPHSFLNGVMMPALMSEKARFLIRVGDLR